MAKFKGPWQHGENRFYAKGCRCDQCRAAHLAVVRGWRREQIAKHGKLPTSPSKLVTDERYKRSAKGKRAHARAEARRRLRLKGILGIRRHLISDKEPIR